MRKYILLLISFILFYSCSLPAIKNPDGVLITNWNLQTFFDGNNDGVEYSEFRKSNSSWSEEKYEERLSRLCEIIEKLDSDVFVMEELENEKILYDISNQLSHNQWFKDKVYPYGYFQKEKGSSIGCGIISRYEIKSAAVHSIDIKTENDKVPSMRSILELVLNVDDNELVLFVNHWKSKSGGAEESEKWRLWQENVLAREMGKYNSGYIVAAGDFNKDISEFSFDENGRLIFKGICESEKKEVPVYSCWLSEGYDETCGSYFYKSKWEKIDHFFFIDYSIVKDFSVADFSPLVKEDGTPYRYQMYTGQGYSDHLPVSCVIKLNDVHAENY